MKRNVPHVKCDVPRIPEISHSLFDDAYLNHTAELSFLDLCHYMSLSGSIHQILPSYNERIVDLACGAGHLSVSLAFEFPNSSILGIDINPKAVSLASKIQMKKARNLNFVQGDVHQLSHIVDQTYLIVCSQSLHHFSDIDNALSQIYSSLRPGGLFYFDDLNRDGFYHYPSRYFQECVPLVRLPSGEVVTLPSGVYNVRKNFTDEESLEIFLNGFFVFRGTENKLLNIVTASSYLAAYKPEEVESLVKKAGFELLYIDSYSSNCGLRGVARRKN